MKVEPRVSAAVQQSTGEQDPWVGKPSKPGPEGESPSHIIQSFELEPPLTTASLIKNSHGGNNARQTTQKPNTSMALDGILCRSVLPRSNTRQRSFQLLMHHGFCFLSISYNVFVSCCAECSGSSLVFPRNCAVDREPGVAVLAQPLRSVHLVHSSWQPPRTDKLDGVSTMFSRHIDLDLLRLGFCRDAECLERRYLGLAL